MPLPTDEKVLAVAEELLKQFDALFGLHPGFRPVHAKGTLLVGTFTPAPEARTLTRAPHVTRPSTPVVVRLSNTTGIPQLPDTDPNANPRGCATRFMLADHVHTDVIAHSSPFFPARTAEDFLAFLQAIAASADSKASPSPIEAYVSTHPAALAFVKPRPVPTSFATEQYFGVSSLRFTNGDGVSRFGRFRVVPNAGLSHLDAAAVASKDPMFLFTDLEERIRREPVRFTMQVQVANDGDTVNDSTVQWPEDRKIVELGKIELTSFVADNAKEQKKIIFDPIPRVDGIEASEDPLLQVRAAIYLLSGRRRRQAP